MPNQHSPDKICVSAWVPRTVHRRLVKKAKVRRMTLTEFVEHLYNNATKDIELIPQDYRDIAKETERARERSGGDGRSGRSHEEAGRRPRGQGAAAQAPNRS